MLTSTSSITRSNCVATLAQTYHVRQSPARLAACTSLRRRSQGRVHRTVGSFKHDTQEISHETDKPGRRNMLQRGLSAAGLLISTLGLSTVAYAQPDLSDFKRVKQTGFIAALGDPEASSGVGSGEWGVWPIDPGPRGVELRNYKSIVAKDGIVPARGGNWTFDADDWWLEEHGLIMESPLSVKLKPGRYIVTGGRSVTTVLTIFPDERWELEQGKLYDVTHLPCRAARYIPVTPAGTPANANLKDFPGSLLQWWNFGGILRSTEMPWLPAQWVTPGAEMPAVEGTKKQDYAVLFVIGIEKTMAGL